MKDIVQSTLAVLFMGCPQRDGQHGNLGDAVVSMAGAVLRINPSDPVLQDLSGAHSAMLNLGRQTFVRLWNDYNFRVRTYQENQPVGSTLRDRQPQHVRLGMLCLMVTVLTRNRSSAVKRPHSEIQENEQRFWKSTMLTCASSARLKIPDISRFHTVLPGLLARNTPEYVLRPRSMMYSNLLTQRRDLSPKELCEQPVGRGSDIH